MVAVHDDWWVQAFVQRVIPLLPARYDWNPAGDGVRAIRVIRGYKWIPDSHHGIGGISTKQFVCAASNCLMETGSPMNTRYEPNDAPEPASCVHIFVDPLDLRAG